MKRILLFMFAGLLGLSAAAQSPVALKIRVNAVQERFYAGPYAKYSVKYLGVEAEQASSTSTVMTAVKVVSVPAASDELGFTSGKPFKKTADFSAIPLLKANVGQRSIELSAARAADQIMDIRQKRYQILTGDTDMSLSGESLKLTLDEFARQENELLKLFLGYTVTNSIEGEFTVLPKAGEDSHLYVAFRISENGLLPAEHIEGRMVTLELIPTNLPEPSDETAAPAKKRKKALKGFQWVSKTEFIPAECVLKMRDGANVLLQGNVVIPQLGYEHVYDDLVPVEKK